MLKIILVPEEIKDGNELQPVSDVALKTAIVNTVYKKYYIMFI
jgi:hypothetical protein